MAYTTEDISSIVTNVQIKTAVRYYYMNIKYL